MVRVNRRVVRVGTFVVFAILLCLGSFAGMSQALAQQDSGGLYIDLYPSGKEVAYACVGKPIQGWFIVSTGATETSLSNPLALLTPSLVQVWTTPPLVGTLSKDSWTISSASATRRFTYTPTKEGEEHLIFRAWILDSSPSPLAKNIDLTVIQCRYRITVHGEFHNRQGSIDSNIFYDGQGLVDLVPNEKGTGWDIKGRGTTQLEEYVDGTEGDVTCVTSAPGKGSSSFLVEGYAVPSVTLNPTFRFRDITTGVGQTCTDKGKGKTMAGGIPLTGWLVNSAENGMLWDLEFSAQGESKQLPISAVNDTRWTDGNNIGSMKIEIMPEAGK